MVRKVRRGFLCAWALCGNNDFGNLRNLVRTLIDDCSIVAPALSFAAIELFSLLWSRVRVYNSKDCGTKKLKPSRVNFIGATRVVVILLFPCRSFVRCNGFCMCSRLCYLMIWWTGFSLGSLLSRFNSKASGYKMVSALKKKETSLIFFAYILSCQLKKKLILS